jgi:hypothetical protein
MNFYEAISATRMLLISYVLISFREGVSNYFSPPTFSTKGESDTVS